MQDFITFGKVIMSWVRMEPGENYYTFKAISNQTEVRLVQSLDMSSSAPTTAYILCNFVLEEVEEKNTYRFGFNGKEKDNETYGDGNAYDFGFRISDSRLGKWLSVDPLWGKYPGFSPYNFCLGNPIINIDPDGRYVIKGKNKDETKNLKAIAKAAKKEAKSWSDDQWKDALASSGYTSKKEYMKMFKNGSGPILEFSGPKGLALGDRNGNAVNPNGGKSAYAEFTPTGNLTSNPDGTTSVDRTAGKITIDYGVHRLLEDLKNSKKAGNPFGVLATPSGSKKVDFGTFASQETALTYAFTTRVLVHENAHAGAWINNDKRNIEHGQVAEMGIYGSIADHTNFGYGVYSAMQGRLYYSHPENSTFVGQKSSFYKALYR